VKAGDAKLEGLRDAHCAYVSQLPAMP